MFLYLDMYWNHLVSLEQYLCLGLALSDSDGAGLKCVLDISLSFDSDVQPRLRITPLKACGNPCRLLETL